MLAKIFAIGVLSFTIHASPAHCDLIPCPTHGKTQDIFENDPEKRCLTEDTEMQGYRLPKGTEIIFFPSKKIRAVELPKDRSEFQGLKWNGWLEFDEKSGKFGSGYLRKPVKFSNGATIGTKSGVSMKNGKITSGVLAKPYKFKGYSIPAGLRVFFYPNGNISEVFIDKESRSIRGPKGEKYGPPAELHFSEDGKFLGFQEYG